MTRRQLLNFVRLLAAGIIAALASYLFQKFTGTPLPLPKGPTP